jgi:transmembrane sensor
MAQGRTQKLIDEQARHWFMLESERALTAAEQAEFDLWRAGPEQQSAYDQLAQICAGLQAIDATDEGRRLRSEESGARQAAIGLASTLANFIRAALRPAPSLAFAMTVVIAVGVGFGVTNSWNMSWQQLWQGEREAQIFSTEIAEVRSVKLQDGSEITLSAGSQISAEFSAARREITLLKGQAFFAVAKDPSRPFYVITPTTSIRVVGTRFDVRRGEEAVKVSVEEGIVDVAERVASQHPDSASTNVRLLAGQQVQVRRGYAGTVMPADIGELASWRQGKLSYHDAPLSEVVADANRYHRGAIILGAPELADLRVTTSFSVDQVETMVSMLEQSLPVNVYREPEHRIVILPKAVN